MENIGSKPSGSIGFIAGRIMNLIHSSAYKEIINRRIAGYCVGPDQKTVLDIGCGGGISVKIFSRLKGIKKTVGMDYSEDMIKLSKKTNKSGTEKGIVEIIQADVSALPFSDSSFDIITAFDTVNFWPDHIQALSEIFRTLKEGGLFFIINAYPKAGTKWHEFVKFKNEREYKEYLSKGGLKNIQSTFYKNTVIVWGRK